MGDLANDPFLNEFLNDTEQIETDIFDSDLRELESMPDDDSLSSYLVGDMRDGTAHRHMKDNPPLHTSPRRHVRGGFGTTQSSTNAENVRASPRSGQPPESVYVVKNPAPVREPSKPKSDGINKRAAASRERRERNKKYVSSLENSVKSLTEENRILKKLGTEQKNYIGKLLKEVHFLRSMIEDKSALSSLLQNSNTASGIKFSTLAEGGVNPQ